MKKQFKNILIYNILLILIFITPNKVIAQNYSINQTVVYVNKLLVENNINNKIKYSNKKLTSIHTHGPSNQFITKQSINIDDVSDVIISDMYISVELKCSNGTSCATNTLGSTINSFQPETHSSQRFYIQIGDYEIAKKVSNAMRYIVEKGKKEITNDPFSSYSSTKANKLYINVSDLELGMSINDVLKKLKTKPVVESVERGYKIYRVNEGGQYFLYFMNNKLVRIDKGVRSPNAIIKIE